MWSLPDRSPWRGILVTIAVLAAAPAVRAQPNDTWLGVGSNLWNDATNNAVNWSTSAPPTTAQTAYFNGAGNGNTTITLGGPQSAGILAFDTSSVASYTIGSSVGDGTLQLASPFSSTISNGGAIAVTQTVTATQTINSNISLPAGAGGYITNYGTTLNLNGAITIAGGFTTNIRTDLSTVSTQASTTNLAGNIAIPSTASTVLRLEENTGGTSTSPAGTLIGTGVISGGLAGSGTTSAYSVLIAGSGVAAQTTGSNPVATLSIGTYQPNPANTYSGGTNLNGTDTLIRITGGSDGNPDGTGITHGPFGTGTIFLTTQFAARLQPANGSNNVIYNAIVESGSNGNVVFNMISSQANDTGSSLTFAGPISNPTASQFYTTNGTTYDENLASPLYGATMYLGLAGTPSTITLSSTSGSKANYNALSGPIVINDAIQSTNSQIVILNNNQLSGLSNYPIRLNNGNSNYQGSTLLSNGAYTNMGATLIGASTNTSSNATFSSGPFGTSTIYPANTTASPFLVPVGGDQTLANALVIGSASGVTSSGSGFTVANYWINTISLQGTPSQSVNTDSGNYYNLTLTGPITMGTSRVINNNMVSGKALTLGLTGANASTISLGANSLTFQSNAGSLPAGYVVGALTVINDAISGTGGLTVQNSATVQLTNANTYSGTTGVTLTTGSVGGTLVASNTSGSATGSGPVNITNGTLQGTGFIVPQGGNALTIAASTGSPAPGGILQPGSASATGTLTVGSGSFSSPTMINGAYLWNLVNHGLPSTTPGGSDTPGGESILSDFGNITVNSGWILSLNELSGSGVGFDNTMSYDWTLASEAGLGTITVNAQPTFVIPPDYAPGPNGVYYVVTGLNPNTGDNELDLLYSPTPVPEPGTLALIVSAAASGVGWYRRRRIRNAC